MERVAVYPGSFDPVTFGHLDVIKRAGRIFDRVVVAVANNDPKKPLFPVDERVRLIRENLGPLDSVEVVSFGGLIVDLARKFGAMVLIRGLRAISDFEYEFQMAQMNRNLDEKLETIFLMPNERYFYTSSNLIKQVARYADRDTQLVPDNVRRALARQFGHSGESDASPTEKA